MSDCEHVSVENRDEVKIVRLNRADKKNALTQPMYQAMEAALRAAEKDDAIRATLFLGLPGAFSAGNDIADFTRMAMGGALGQPIIDFLYALCEAEKPLIAGVDGLAIGIGTTMLMHCDYVLASDRSLFKTPFTDLALVPEAASTLLAPAIMGHQRAFELLCMGENFDASVMQQMGLVNKVTSVEDLEEASVAAAQTIAAKPVGAMRLARNLMKIAGRDAIRGQIDREAEAFRTQLASKEAQAAFMAFLSKKK